MTIQEAIDRVDMLKPNKQPEEFKIKWLSELDGLIHREIILKHAHSGRMRHFDGYDEDTNPGQVLLAPYPYDEIYTWWLMSKVDLQNQEIDKYNNDRTLFNNAYDTLSDWWTRNHMPITTVREIRI